MGGNRGDLAKRGENLNVEQLFGLDGRVAVITGGSGVLAREIARGYLDAGASVVLLGTTPTKLDHALSDLDFPASHAHGIVCDVRDENQVRRTSEQILARHNRVDILVNGAGGNTPGATLGAGEKVFDLNIDEFRQVGDLNFLGTVIPSVVFSRAMAERQNGSIINISSMAAQRAISRVGGYSAAKAAVENFTRWMAIETARMFGDRIRVNAIAPGFFLTDQNRSLLTTADGSLTERGATIIRVTPFGRFGAPEELVGAALWLASEASRFVTGAVIPIDGGFSVQSGV